MPASTFSMIPSLATNGMNQGGTNSASNTTDDHSMLISILSQTVNSIVTTSKKHLANAIIANATTNNISNEDTNQETSENDDSNLEISLTDDQEIEYKNTLVGHLQTFMNRLHEHQSMIYLRYAQSLDTGSIFDRNGISSSAASTVNNPNDNASNDTNMLTLDNSASQNTGTSGCLEVTSPDIPGIRSPPPNDFVRNRILEAARARREERLRMERDDYKYAKSLQMEDNDKRQQAWHSWRARNNSMANPQSQYNYDRASRDSFKWTHRPDPTYVNFHEEQQRKWNSDNGFSIWDKRSPMSPPFRKTPPFRENPPSFRKTPPFRENPPSFRKTPPPYKYIDHNTGSFKFGTDSTPGPANDDTIEDIWDDVDNKSNSSMDSGQDIISDFRFSPIQRNNNGFQSSALEHFGDDMSHDIDRDISNHSNYIYTGNDKMYSGDNIDVNIEFDANTNKDDPDFIGNYTKYGPNNEIINDIDDESDRVSDSSSDISVNDEEETLQCNGRIGFTHYNIASKPVDFIASYPHNVYVTNKGVIVGDPCAERIPANEFYGNQKVLCNECMKKCAGNITEPVPETLATSTLDTSTLDTSTLDTSAQHISSHDTNVAPLITKEAIEMNCVS